jgi:trk system potassium uptake protein TrkA
MDVNVVIVGYSSFSWALAMQLRGRVSGRLYFVLSERERAIEASLHEDIVAVNGDMTDTGVLDQLDLSHCHTFVAASREEQANVLAALYAKNNGVQNAYARVFEMKFIPLLEAVGIRPLQTSQIAATFTATRILETDGSQ